MTPVSRTTVALCMTPVSRTSALYMTTVSRTRCSMYDSMYDCLKDESQGRGALCDEVLYV